MGEEKHKSLKNCNDTRWSSTHTMLKSFNESFQSINLALSQINCTDLIIGTEERKLLVELEEFFQIFEICVKTLQGVLYPKLFLFIVFYRKMLKR